MMTKRVGSVTYSSTLIRPGYFPFRLGDESLPASKRLEPWVRDRKLWGHISSHITQCRWPTQCPYPLCDLERKYEVELQFHFMDDHGISRVRACQTDHPACLLPDNLEQNSHKRKRPHEDEDVILLSPRDFEHAMAVVKPPKGRLRIAASSLARTVSPASLSKHADLHSAWTVESPVDCVKYDELSLTECDESSIHTKKWPLEDSDLFVSTDVCDDSLFSQYLRSRSPSCVSTAANTEYSGVTAVESEAGDSPLTPGFLGQQSEKVGGIAEVAPSRPRLRLMLKKPEEKIVLHFPRLQSTTGKQSRTQKEIKETNQKQLKRRMDKTKGQKMGTTRKPKAKNK